MDLAKKETPEPPGRALRRYLVLTGRGWDQADPCRVRTVPSHAPGVSTNEPSPFVDADGSNLQPRLLFPAITSLPSLVIIICVMTPAVMALLSRVLAIL